MAHATSGPNVTMIVPQSTYASSRPRLAASVRLLVEGRDGRRGAPSCSGRAVGVGHMADHAHLVHEAGGRALAGRQWAGLDAEER